MSASLKEITKLEGLTNLKVVWEMSTPVIFALIKV